MHFTFQPPSDADLQQGDLIRKTETLCQLLREVHPHYLRSDYSYFVILTQSCDLVRRPGRDGKPACNSRYITMAAVRPLDIVIKREIERYQGELEAKADVCSKDRRARIEMFLERLLNNNQDEYFYLQAEPAASVPENSCAFLRLSISLRAYEHYELCLQSRCLSLNPVFQAKLGWLVGNLYSRVGTEDWTAAHFSEEDFKERISTLMDTACLWVDEQRLRQARRTLRNEVQVLDREALRARIDQLAIQPKIDTLADQVVAVLKEAGMLATEPEAARIRVRIRNDPSLAKLAK